MARMGYGMTSGLAATVAMLMGWVASAGADGQLATAAPVDGAQLSATVTVTRALLTEEGALVRELPTSRYAVAQYRDGRLKMTMLGTAPGPRIGPMADPYAGIVVEGDLSRGTLELRAPDGTRLALPGEATFPGAPGASESFLAEASRTDERRQALERAYGRPQGRLRGLLRYVARRRAAVEEVLVSAETLLPAELSVVKDGVLTEHHAFSYVAVPGKGWVRHHSSAQTLVAGQRPQRLLSVTALDDIRTSGGAR
ncbi:MAG: hypothetical protein KA371_01825 [Acidobacteria bacterium]|nr:hypothetical protein [Acidobacteriota bacterium]